MKNILSFVLALFFINACTAQPKMRREVLPPPSIQANNLRKGESPIRVSDVKIDVKVIGSIAVTTVDMTFYNPNNRILEGELQFPLGEGQNVSRFALDINGKLREGVVVEKAKGQEVFESVIRQNVDPGLLEKTQGNNFRARIYPLPAKGNRRIVIAYEQELGKEDNRYQVFIPVDYKDTLNTFNLNLCVFGNDITPKVEETPWSKFAFDKSGEAYIASFSAKDYLVKGQLVISVPDKKKQQVFIEKGKLSGETVFYAQINPQFISQSKKLPSKVALYWDASLSMSDRNMAMETDLLAQYFNKIGNLTVDLHVFNCIAMPVKSFSIKNGNWNELKKYLQTVPYDGATQLGILDLKNVKADEILLFSDGLSNFGKILPSTGRIPVTTVSSSLKADYGLLQYLALTTGGKYINLMKQSAEQSLNLLLEDSFRFISAEYDSSEITELTTSSVLIKPTSGFSVAGRLKSKTASMILNFGIGNEVLSSHTITINAKDIADYDNIVERVWAEKKINELDILYEKNKKEIGQLGRKYNIVTRNTSLIVLDRLEDYLANEIVPPSELLEQYELQRRTIEKDKADTEKQHIELVVSMFNERKEWWNRVFPKTKPYNQSKRANNSSMSITVAEVQGSNESNSLDVYVFAESVPVMADRPMEEVSYMMYNAPVVAEDIAESNKVATTVKFKTESVSRTVATIQLKNWNPDTPYLNILKTKPNKDLYASYLEIRDEYKSSPSFYLDVATLFEERGLKQEALIILSNLAELEIENYRLLRVLGHRLAQLGYTEYAIDQFEAVMQLRPEEPQSFRDLASALEQDKQYQKSVDMLYEIIRQPWDGRFPEIELIAAVEMNKVIALAMRENVKLSLDRIDKRLIFNMPVDVRIVLNWDTDNSDMDLWITDPYGEKCFYNNALTRIGGMISRDFTGGYGPEEFLIRQAVNGKYTIQANYYGSREQTLIGPTTIYLDIFTRFANGHEKKKTITMRLTDNNEVIDIGEIIFSDK